MTSKIEIAQSYLYDHIPITKHLGVIVNKFDGRRIELTAPLEPNINHRDSAFGGSLSSVAILAGWTILHLKLLEKKINARLVIQKSSINYLDAVLSDFTAACELPAAEQWHSFLNMLNAKGKARLTLSSKIYSDGKLVCEQEGVYVAVT